VLRTPAGARGVRWCLAMLTSRYGDIPAMRRIGNDAERILAEVDRLDIDADELDIQRADRNNPASVRRS
jgi:hypothetical protein